jgi:hypothetical protein
MDAAGQRSDRTSSSETHQTEQSKGWDPYEVWRTRVLLPRLESLSLKKVSRDAVNPDGQPASKVTAPIRHPQADSNETD